jgi:DNA-binding CsgD family transcriptional regulator
LFMSAYRSGRWARNIEPSETNFWRCALDHVQYLTLQGSWQGSCSDNAEAANLLVNAKGRILSASPEALRFIGWHWRGWKPEYLPPELTTAPSPEQTRHLLDLGVVLDRRRLENRSGSPLYGIALRRANAYDRLTARERQIADEIANGRTHKEIAKILVLSPATVRNHTQAILMKLGLHNRAALAKQIHAAKPA